MIPRDFWSFENWIMKCELQVIRETWRVRTDFERIAGCFRYVNDQTTDRAGFLVHKILFLVLNSRIYCGRSPHGERGLKSQSCLRTGACRGRSPHGERGLKSCRVREVVNAYMSLPTRGAWIEMRSASDAPSSRPRRSPHGERGLKSRHRKARAPTRAVAPHTGSVD